MSVHVATGVFSIFALEQMRDTAREFNDFQSPLQFTRGVPQRLAVLGRNDRRKPFTVVNDRLTKTEQHRGAL